MLFVVSTPIGNLEDITLRALRVLSEADVIVAEDTRHTGLLLKHFKIEHKILISLYDEVEAKKVPDLLEIVKSEKRVVLVSDAGTPLISDPGYKLVREAIVNGVSLEAIPGPTALICGLTVSGLPPDKFIFLGYPPEKMGKQKEMFRKLKEIQDKMLMTAIFYVSPHKIHRNLEMLKEVFGDIEIVVARELTKIHQNVWKAKISETIEFLKDAKGEMVLMFHL